VRKGCSFKIFTDEKLNYISSVDNTHEPSLRSIIRQKITDEIRNDVGATNELQKILFRECWIVRVIRESYFFRE
jgi:hypothetical protein